MAVTTVQILVDQYDGTGTLVTQGMAEFYPQQELRDTPDGMRISTAMDPAVFSAAAPPVIRLIASDAAGPQPAGWAWQVAFVNVPGNPAPFAFFAPAGPCSFTATSASPAVFTWTPTAAFTAASLAPLPNGTVVKLAGGSLPAGFTAGTSYYVVASSALTFQLSAALGGSPVASTSTGSGTFSVAQYNLSALSPVGSVNQLSAYDISGAAAAALVTAESFATSSTAAASAYFLRIFAV